MIANTSEHDSVVGRALEWTKLVLWFGFFIVAMTVLSSLANAQSALKDDPAVLATKVQSGTSGNPFLYSGTVLLSTARTANEAEPIAYSGAYQLTASALHKASVLNGTVKLAYSREYTKNMDDDKPGDIVNPQFSLSKTFLDKTDFDGLWVDSLALSLLGVAGLSRESKRRHHVGSGGFGVTAGKRLGRFNLRQGVSYSYGVYEYDIRGNGVVNSPHVYRSLSSVYVSLTDALTFAVDLSYAYAVSFQGVGKVTQIANLGLEYAFNDRVAISVGAETERGTLEPDGQSNRVRLFAPEAAHYTVDVAVSM